MEDLRMLMRIKRIPYWKIAEKVNRNESTIYRWFRTYDKNRHDLILNTIKELCEVTNRDMEIINTYCNERNE